MTIGSGEWTRRPVAVFRLCGQPARGPSEVAAQSNERISPANSLLLFRKSISVGRAIGWSDRAHPQEEPVAAGKI